MQRVHQQVLVSHDGEPASQQVHSRASGHGQVATTPCSYTAGSGELRALEHLAKQVGSVLPQEEDEFEEMFEYPTEFPTELMGRSAKSYKHAARDRSVGTEPEAAAVSYLTASTLEDVVHPHFNQRGDSDPMMQQGTLQHNEHDDSCTNINPLHSTASISHEKVNDNVLKKGLDKYHLLHSIELSDSSEEELHLNQDMTSEHSAACVPKDQGTFEDGSIESKNPLLPHILHRFPNYFFEGSEELTYSDDFQTDKSYDRRTVYQRTHATRTGSGHAGSGVAFDHSLSPLYGMSVLQLKQLLLSLRTKVEGKFLFYVSTLLSLIVGLFEIVYTGRSIVIMNNCDLAFCGTTR